MFSVDCLTVSVIVRIVAWEEEMRKNTIKMDAIMMNLKKILFDYIIY